MDYQNNPWADALAQQENERKHREESYRLQQQSLAHQRMVQDQKSDYDAMMASVGNENQAKAQDMLAIMNLLASGVRCAMNSPDGKLPQGAVNYMNHKLDSIMARQGIKSTGKPLISSGYLASDGSFLLSQATENPDIPGDTFETTFAHLKPQSIYSMMAQNRTVFNDDDRRKMGEHLVKNGFSQSELDEINERGVNLYYGPIVDRKMAAIANEQKNSLSNIGTNYFIDREAYRSYMKNHKTSDPDHISNQMGGGAGGREIGSGAVMKKVDRRPRDVEMYSNFREPGMTAGGYVSGRKADGTRYGYNLGRQKSEAGLWHQFSVGPSDDGKTQVRGYENELTGEVVYVKDGENPPWRQSQGNNGKLSVDDRLAIEREKNKGKIDVENARGQNRIDLANLTGEQKKELQNSINAMKKYGIDVTSAVRMAIGGNRTKNVPFNDKVFTYYSNRLDVLNSKGTLTAAEQKERDKAQRIVDGMTNGVMGIEEKQETPDWMSAFASGDAANTAKPQNREEQKSAQNAQVQKPSKTTNAQATAVQKQTAAPQGEDFGLRPDGTKKGNGWLGVLRNSKGQAVTEYSMQSEAVKVDGKRIDFPMLVPTLNNAEKDAVLAASANEQYDKDAFSSAEQKAVDHARARLADGKSVWADESAESGTKQSAKSAPVTKLTPAEKSVGRDAVAMFKKIHPDITDVDDNPEKYDKQLTSIAQSLSGDYNYKSNFTLQKERDRKAAQDKELQQTAAEQENLRKQTLANLNGRDKVVYQKAMELYAPLYERAKLQAREDHGGDYEESVRKKFAEYVKEYNTKHGLKFVDGLSRPDRQVFGDYHVADLLSDIFGNDAGKYLGLGGSRGNSQLRLQSHGKNK